MVYEYECGKCGQKVDSSFRMGQAKKSVECPACGGRATRVFSSFALEVNGGINRKSTFGEEMRQRNVKAGKRMRGQKAPVRTIAHDYGNGDVREAK
jgi:putative FmdB family regulatory protein